VEYNPPKEPGVDDETGEALVQRKDDEEETVRERFTVYRKQTEPLIDFYSSRADGDKLRYVTVNGLGKVENIQEEIVSALRN
jgi:adenylate kinase